jgi:hypothetical protein
VICILKGVVTPLTSTKMSSSKVTLYTGFSAITTDKFRESTLKKGFKLVLSNHVFNVKEEQEDGKPTIIYARCVRQASVTKEPYKLRFVLDTDRKISKCQCSCIAGINGNCKHCAALVNYINNERDDSKTAQPCQWQKPSSRGKELYPKGKKLSELFQSNFPFQPHTFSPPSPEIQDRFKQLLSKSQEESGQLFKVMTTTLSETSGDQEASSPCSEEIKSLFQIERELPPASFVAKVQSTGKILLIKLHKAIPFDLQVYFDTKVHRSAEDCLNICNSTIRQSSCNAWFSERSFRITASKAHKILRARTPETQLRHFFSVPICTKSMRYGIAMELEAKKKFQELNPRLEIIDVGLVICPEQCWLAASPDSLIKDENGDLHVLEIKCPLSCANSQIRVKYLDDQDQLSRKDLYYCQVQLQMFVTGLKKCFFFVFSRQDYKQVIVHHDQDFV